VGQKRVIVLAGLKGERYPLFRRGSHCAHAIIRSIKMTFERKIVVGLEDIKAVSFACEQCQFKLTMSPDDVKKIPEHCPSGHEWYFGQDEPHVVPAIKNSISPSPNFGCNRRERPPVFESCWSSMSRKASCQS
jgi:hypothetical protein